MNFLSNVLREEGGFEYKKTIVDCILCLVKSIPDATEAGLTHLSEFIEDCEFTYLSSQVLHLLGELGPSTADPGKYIRYIYNRVILENATIRASAVCALANFGSCSVALRARVLTLLQRCLYDNDDEVRDRAAFFLSMLRTISETNSECVEDPLIYPLAPLEASLQQYLENTGDSAFDLAVINQIHDNIASHPDMHASAFDCPSMNTSSTKNDLRESENIITSRGEFMSYGPIFKVSSYSSSVVNRQELHNWTILHLVLVLAELSRCGPHWSRDGVQGKLSALHAKSKCDQYVFIAELVKIL